MSDSKQTVVYIDPNQAAPKARGHAQRQGYRGRRGGGRYTARQSANCGNAFAGQGGKAAETAGTVKDVDNVVVSQNIPLTDPAHGSYAEIKADLCKQINLDPEDVKMYNTVIDGLPHVPSTLKDVVHLTPQGMVVDGYLVNAFEAIATAEQAVVITPSSIRSVTPSDKDTVPTVFSLAFVFGYYLYSTKPFSSYGRFVVNKLKECNELKSSKVHAQVKLQDAEKRITEMVNENKKLREEVENLKKQKLASGELKVSVPPKNEGRAGSNEQGAGPSIPLTGNEEYAVIPRVEYNQIEPILNLEASEMASLVRILEDDIPAFLGRSPGHISKRVSSELSSLYRIAHWFGHEFSLKYEDHQYFDMSVIAKAADLEKKVEELESTILSMSLSSKNNDEELECVIDPPPTIGNSGRQREGKRTNPNVISSNPPSDSQPSKPSPERLKEHPFDVALKDPTFNQGFVGVATAVTNFYLGKQVRTSPKLSTQITNLSKELRELLFSKYPLKPVTVSGATHYEKILNE